MPCPPDPAGRCRAFRNEPWFRFFFRPQQPHISHLFEILCKMRDPWNERPPRPESRLRRCRQAGQAAGTSLFYTAGTAPLVRQKANQPPQPARKRLPGKSPPVRLRTPFQRKENRRPLPGLFLHISNGGPVPEILPLRNPAAVSIPMRPTLRSRRGGCFQRTAARCKRRMLVTSRNIETG